MALNGKKISFGFSKTSKQNSPLKQISTSKEKIQYVDCLDSKVIVCKKDEDVEKEEQTDLVIPLNRTGDQMNRDVSVQEKNEGAGKDDTRTDTAEAESTKEQTLEEKAVKEILDGAKGASDVKEEPKSSYLQILNARHKIEISNESTLDDYENVPITDFGMAMLRGMGWEPDKSTTKTEGDFSAETPQVRPRGMGLGADKVTPTSIQKDVSSDGEELKVVKGAYVQVTSGSFKGHYGQIEGFMNEDDGRIIIKLAMQPSTVSLYEYVVKVVTKGEYDKNSRVLNVSKYEEYKQKSERRQSEGMQHEENKNSSDNMSDRERRGDTTDGSSEEKHGIKRMKHKSDRSSEDKSDDSERRQHKTEKHPEVRSDSEKKRHKTSISSEDTTSDDSDKRRHKIKKYAEDRSDRERKRKSTGISSEETSDDSDRRRHKIRQYSEDRSDSERKRHRRSSEETSDDSSRRHRRSNQSSLERISEERSDDSDRKGHRKNGSSEDRSDDSSKRRHKSRKHSRDRR